MNPLETPSHSRREDTLTPLTLDVPRNKEIENAAELSTLDFQRYLEKVPMAAAEKGASPSKSTALETAPISHQAQGTSTAPISSTTISAQDIPHTSGEASAGEQASTPAPPAPLPHMAQTVRPLVVSSHSVNFAHLPDPYAPGELAEGSPAPAGDSDALFSNSPCTDAYQDLLTSFGLEATPSTPPPNPEDDLMDLLYHSFGKDPSCAVRTESLGQDGKGAVRTESFGPAQGATDAEHCGARSHSSTDQPATGSRRRRNAVKRCGGPAALPSGEVRRPNAPTKAEAPRPRSKHRGLRSAEAVIRRNAQRSQKRREGRRKARRLASTFRPSGCSGTRPIQSTSFTSQPKLQNSHFQHRGTAPPRKKSRDSHMDESYEHPPPHAPGNAHT